jgi:hypothetical protein
MTFVWITSWKKDFETLQTVQKCSICCSRFVIHSQMKLICMKSSPFSKDKSLRGMQNVTNRDNNTTVWGLFVNFQPFSPQSVPFSNSKDIMAWNCSNERDAPSAFLLLDYVYIESKRHFLPVLFLLFRSVFAHKSRKHIKGNTLDTETFKSHLAQLSKVRERESFASEPSSSSSCISERMDGRHSSPFARYLTHSKPIFRFFPSSPDWVWRGEKQIQMWRRGHTRNSKLCSSQVTPKEDFEFF